MKHWLMKTEPDVFSFDALVAAANHTSCWEGVRNYQARNFMRDEFKKGDEVFIYHSSTEVPAVMGIAQVVREAYPDASALDKKSEYFDEKSAKDGVSRWVMVDVRATLRFKKPVTLAAIRATKGLEEMLLLKRGQRLSIQPVADKHWDKIVKMGEAVKV